MIDQAWGQLVLFFGFGPWWLAGMGICSPRFPKLLKHIFKAVIIEKKNTHILEKLLRPCAPTVLYRTTFSSPLSACLLQQHLHQHLQQSKRLIVWSQSWIKYLYTMKFTRKPEIKMIGNLLFQKKLGLNGLQRFSLLYGSCYMKYTNQSCPYSNRHLNSILVFLLPWRLGSSWPDFSLKFPFSRATWLGYDLSLKTTFAQQHIQQWWSIVAKSLVTQLTYSIISSWNIEDSNPPSSIIKYSKNSDDFLLNRRPHTEDQTIHHPLNHMDA